MLRTAAIVAFGGCAYFQAPTALHAKARGPVSYQRDAEKSDLQIWLSKKGVMSAVGHNLVLKVHDWQSKLSMTPDGECELFVEVETKSIEVSGHWKPASEKEVSVPGINGAPVTFHAMDSWSTGQIHGTMRGKDVLDVAKYPKVLYHGKGVKGAAGLQFEGVMTLKGVEKPHGLATSLIVQPGANGAPTVVLKGETTFMQTNWGVKPVSAFFGSLQLKDEITAKWEVHFVPKEE